MNQKCVDYCFFGIVDKVDEYYFKIKINEQDSRVIKTYILYDNVHKCNDSRFVFSVLRASIVQVVGTYK